MNVRAEANEAALRLLHDHWAGNIPVEPKWIARSLGIEVAGADLDSRISGLIEYREGRARIHLNRGDHEVRQRFTLAHEIGHFVRNGESDFEYVDYRAGMASKGTDPDEVFANAFAAALLMPQTAVQELAEHGVSEKQMARELGVSTTAMVTRLKTLGWYPLPRAA